MVTHNAHSDAPCLGLASHGGHNTRLCNPLRTLSRLMPGTWFRSSCYPGRQTRRPLSRRASAAGRCEEWLQGRSLLCPRRLQDGRYPPTGRRGPICIPEVALRNKQLEKCPRQAICRPLLFLAHGGVGNHQFPAHLRPCQLDDPDRRAPRFGDRLGHQGDAEARATRSSSVSRSLTSKAVRRSTPAPTKPRSTSWRVPQDGSKSTKVSL